MFSNVFDKWEMFRREQWKSHWFCFITSFLQVVETENDERKKSQAEKVPSSFLLFVAFAAFHDQLMQNNGDSAK